MSHRSAAPAFLDPSHSGGLLATEEAVSSADGLTHLIDRVLQAGTGSDRLHVVSDPIRRVSGQVVWLFVRCACGHVWSVVEGCACVCPVEEAEAVLLASVRRAGQEYATRLASLKWLGEVEQNELTRTARTA